MKVKSKKELSDTQLLILQAAATNKYHSILPYSKAMRSYGATLSKATEGLVSLGFIKRDNHVFQDEDTLKDALGAHTYRITHPGLSAIDEPKEPKMAKKSPKSPLSEEERAALANAGAIADKAMEEIQGEPAPEASPAASEPPSGAEEVSGTVDHSIPVETDTPEKVAQRKLLKVKMDLMKVKEAELTDLYADIESAVKETKELRRVIRETAKDIAMFVTNITGVKTSARPGKVRTGKVIVAPGGKAIGRQPTVSMRGKVIVPLKTDVNPNRSGSLRAGAYEIIMRNPNGIAISEYQKAGGRYPDIKFFLLKGFIKLEYPNYGIEEAEETGSETEAVPATETEATTESATV